MPENPISTHLEQLQRQLAEYRALQDAKELENLKIYDFIKQTEQAIRESRRYLEERIQKARATETQFQGLLEAAPDAIIGVDRNGKIILVNGQAEQLFGFDRSELIGQPVETLLPSHLHTRHRRHRTGYVNAPYTRPMGLGMDLIARKKNGCTFPVEVSLSPLETPDGLIVTSIIRDVTERKNLENQLRQYNEKLETLVDLRTAELKSERDFNTQIIEQANSLVMALSVDGVILLLNRGYEEISGFQRDALIGRDWIDTLLPSDAREQGRRIFHEIVAGQIPEFWESPLHASDGSVHTIKWHIGVVRDKSETISNIVFIGRDMTEERRLQEQVILSERLATVGRMAAQVAHEIRNPLSSIGLNIELLADEIHDQGLGNSGESRELIDNVLSQIERLNGVINDYLRFARMPVKHLKPECVNDLIRELAQFLQPETAAAHVRLTLNLCEAPPDIEIDRNLISQALLNCIRNAMEAMPEGGDLTLATGIKENHVEIGITDTGVGIAAEHLDRVFDPFFSTKDYGTGLGLPYVRQIVQEHRGEILIHSAPGKGAALTLRFPIAQPGSEEKDGS